MKCLCQEAKWRPLQDRMERNKMSGVPPYRQQNTTLSGAGSPPTGIFLTNCPSSRDCSRPWPSLKGWLPLQESRAWVEVFLCGTEGSIWAIRAYRDHAMQGNCVSLNQAWATWSTKIFLDYPKILTGKTPWRNLDVEGKQGST